MKWNALPHPSPFRLWMGRALLASAVVLIALDGPSVGTWGTVLTGVYFVLEERAARTPKGPRRTALRVASYPCLAGVFALLALRWSTRLG